MAEIRLTTWDVSKPVNNGISYLSAGAGLLPFPSLPFPLHKPKKNGRQLSILGKVPTQEKLPGWPPSVQPPPIRLIPGKPFVPYVLLMQ